jgi:hypothetical protein
MSGPDQKSTSSPSTRKWGNVVLLLFLLVCSLGLGFVGYAFMQDAIQLSRTTEFWWGALAFASATTLLVGALSTLVNVRLKRRWLNYFGTTLITLTTIGNLVLVALGIAMVEQAKARGGDWGALHVGITRLFGVGLPMILTLVCGVATAFYIGQLRKNSNSSS